MKMKTINICILILVIASCSSKKSTERLEKTKPNVESFDVFYSRFNSDSIFQINRIDFPMEGFKLEGDYNPLQEIENHIWTRDNWNFFSINSGKNSYNFSLEKTDSLIKETITVDNSGFEVYREFKLKDSIWIMTYFGRQQL